MADGKTYDNTGIISKNEKKEQPNHADYNGSATIDGVEYFVDCWVKERNDNSGRKFLSMKFKPKKTNQGGNSNQKGGGQKKEEQAESEYDF